MNEHRRDNTLEGIDTLMTSARRGMVYSFGGVLVLAIVVSIGLRQAGHEPTATDAGPGLSGPVSAVSEERNTRHMPRTFHDMERPHPLHLLTPAPMPDAEAP